MAGVRLGRTIARLRNTGPEHDQNGTARETPTSQARAGAIRTGWNDGAWSQQRRAISGPLAHWYELGYTGGLVFNQSHRMRD